MWLAVQLNAFGISALAGASNEPPESTPLGAFALPDSSGRRVIALSPVSSPSHVRHLVTRDGRLLRVRYTGTQRGSDQGTGRDATRDFRYLGGAVFQVRGGTIPPDETCFLAADSLLRQRTLIPLKRALQTIGPEHEGVRTAERLEARSVKRAWQLACARQDTCVLLLEFEPRGASRLFSVALWRRGSIAMLDRPAEIRDEDSTSVWRVDDGGQIGPDAFDVEFFLRGDGGSYLGIEWSGAEGLSLDLLHDSGQGKLEEVYSSYRYLSP